MPVFGSFVLWEGVGGENGEHKDTQGLLVFYYTELSTSTSSTSKLGDFLISKLVTVMPGISIIHKEEPW